MTRRLNWWILIVGLVTGVPYYWLMLDTRPGKIAPKPVSIAQLRQLAAQIPGAAPSHVEMEIVAVRRVAGTVFAAGSGLKPRQIAVLAFRLPVPGGKAVMIDTGVSEADARDMGIPVWDKTAQARVDQAMAGAGLILVTHEHPDHLGGVVKWAGPSVFSRARLNPAQAKEAARLLNLREVPQTPAAEPPFAVAPGVVVIPAPSHTPGSQMVFVRLADGREYLFAGDIATLESSWKELRARSRLVSDYIAPEDRPEVFAWLKTIQALREQHPALVIVPGHDPIAILYELPPNGISEGFRSSTVQAPAGTANQ